MKVLQIGTTYRFGGIESFLLNYAKKINRDDLEYDFLVIDDTEEIKNYYESLIKTGSRIIKVVNYRKHPIKGLKQIVEIINNNNYEIIHYNMNSAVYLLPLIAGKISDAKIVIAHSHNSSSDKGIVKKIIHNINKHFIPFFANYFFACSEKSGEWFFSKKIRKNKNYKIIKNAIDSDEFTYNESIRNNIRKELKYSNNDIVIGHVGRFNEQKNHIFLISVFEKLYKINENYKLLLIGEGPTKKSIVEIIEKSDYKKNVTIFSQRNDINKIMQGMDAFILPSLYEGLPLVGIEAQCSGLKCFFSDNITRELEITPNAIYINKEKSAEEWANIIHKEMQKDINRNTINYIEKAGFDIKKSILNLVKIYKDGIDEVNNQNEKN